MQNNKHVNKQDKLKRQQPVFRNNMILGGEELCWRSTEETTSSILTT